MRTEIRPKEPSALAIVLDEQFASDASALDTDDLEGLKRAAEAGKLFLMHTDDPISYRLDIYVDERPAPELDIYFTERSGSHLLRAPTGRLELRMPIESDRSDRPTTFAHTFEVPAGDYGVFVRHRADFDARAHGERVERTVGTRDWRFYQRLNWIGAAGCLMLGLAVLLALVPGVRRDFWPFLLPLALPTFISLVAARLPRYRRVEAAIEDMTKDLPVYLLVMTRVGSAEGLLGGWYRD